MTNLALSAQFLIAWTLLGLLFFCASPAYWHHRWWYKIVCGPVIWVLYLLTPDGDEDDGTE